MFRRLRRPGYWIVFFALLSVYFYRQYRHHEDQQRQAAKMQLYRTYGETILKGLEEGNLTGIQQHFASGREGQISLEDIALFVTTLHLDRGHEAQWKELKEGEGKVTMRGNLILEGNVSYPMDMMVVRRGKKILLKRLHVGPQTLELHSEGFPFRDVPERNVSKK